MVIVMETDAPAEAIEAVVSHLISVGATVHRSSGQTRTILGVVGSVGANDAAVIDEMDFVAKVVRISEPYRLASRRFRQAASVVEGEWGAIGGPRPWLALEAIDGAPRNEDAPPPSLPYAVAAGRPFDAAVSRSAEGPDSLGALACLSLHARPIDNKWPVRFVARKPGASLRDWLELAERELVRRADHVVLLETGEVRSDGTPTLDVTNIPRIVAATHLPVVVDIPSVAGRRQHASAVACAVIAAGASGVILRVSIGSEGGALRAPSTLGWDAAVDIAAKLRAIGEAVLP